jgi:hypothetical protein
MLLRCDSIRTDGLPKPGGEHGRQKRQTLYVRRAQIDTGKFSWCTGCVRSLGVIEK